MANVIPGDLVYIIDPSGDEPYKMGIGLVIGETKKHGTDWIRSTPVLWNGKVEYLDAEDWMFEIIKRS